MATAAATLAANQCCFQHNWTPNKDKDAEQALLTACAVDEEVVVNERLAQVEVAHRGLGTHHNPAGASACGSNRQHKCRGAANKDASAEGHKKSLAEAQDRPSEASTHLKVLPK